VEIRLVPPEEKGKVVTEIDFGHPSLGQAEGYPPRLDPRREHEVYDTPENLMHLFLAVSGIDNSYVVHSPTPIQW